MYGTMYGMDKTTVYLPSELKAALSRAARRRRTSEAELIREGIALVAAEDEYRTPRIPLFESGQPNLAANVDEALRGFGER
jgi:Arc/MetJ-type ribon-helix-helix transcriptional regulator